MNIATGGQKVLQAEERLARAVEHLFMEPQDFFWAFRCNPHQAIIALRDEPQKLGQLRTYVGKTALETARREIVAAARALYQLTHGRAAVWATRQERKRNKA